MKAANATYIPDKGSYPGIEFFPGPNLNCTPSSLDTHGQGSVCDKTDDCKGRWLSCVSYYKHNPKPDKADNKTCQYMSICGTQIYLPGPNHTADPNDYHLADMVCENGDVSDPDDDDVSHFSLGRALYNSAKYFLDL